MIGILTRLIPWGFLLYFIILFIERLQSLMYIFSDNNSRPLSNRYGAYTNILTIFSLLVTLVLLLGFNENFFRSLFSNVTPNYTMLIITSGVLLLSGMVHTKHTLIGLQFIAYGFLIASMVLKTITLVNEDNNILSHWFFLVFAVMFSMAIPVVYKSNIKNSGVFHYIEAILSIVLVVVFTYYLYLMFTSQFPSIMMIVIPILVLAVGNAIIISMRWSEETNWFTLIFTILTIILGIGDIVFGIIPRIS